MERKSLRLAALAVSCAFLTGCAVNLQFIDRATGERYSGVTGSTYGSTGSAQAEIDGDHYAGDWIYSSSGGGYSLSNAWASSGTATATASGMGTFMSAAGSGMMNLSSDKHRVRCVFNYNTFSKTGIGQCQREDGKAFDLLIKP